MTTRFVGGPLRDPTALDPAVSDPPLDDHVGTKHPFNSLSYLQDAPPSPASVNRMV
jgi:hypothetical protein